MPWTWTSLSADGRRLAVHVIPLTTSFKDFKKIGFKDVGIRVLDTTTGEELFSVKDLPAPVFRMRLSADGKRVVVHIGSHFPWEVKTNRSELLVWDIETKKQIGSYRLPTAPMKDVGSHLLEAVSPDGRLAAFSYYRAEADCVVLKVWELPRDGEATECKELYERVLSNERVDASNPDHTATWFSSDGRFLVFSTTPTDAKGLPTMRKWVNHIVDLSTQNEVSRFDDPDQSGPRASIVAISPDGKFLALHGTTKTPGSTGDILVVDRQGNKKLHLMGHTGRVTSVAFSPDGQRLASLSGEIKLWDLHNGQEVLTLTTTGAGFAGSALQFSGDGHRLFRVARLHSDKVKWCYDLDTWDATPLPEPPP
jgi:WD40 repeat protein